MAEKSDSIKLPVLTCWETPVQVFETDFDNLGHVNNVMYLRYVQDVATRHWEAIATKEQFTSSVWVVGRHEIDYKQSILPGDEVVGLTWTHKPQGMRFPRSVWLVSPDRKRLYAQAYTIWLLINPETGRPKRADEPLIERFLPWMAES